MLMQICDNFVSSMQCYATDFAEQRATLLDETALSRHYEAKGSHQATTMDSKREAQKMLKGKTSAFSLKRLHSEAFKPEESRQADIVKKPMKKRDKKKLAKAVKK